ncbi:MAG: hypothetical protein K8S21_04650 [Gemmatimonadetes bacterium]|nr:hypothetical protein [Gemmatimonadota bacterium]
MTCKEIGDWITDNVEKPLDKWRVDATKKCTEARKWLEERRTELEQWWRSVTTQCLEQPCQWLCLCCNKWLCWLLDILVRILIITLQIIEHVIEAVCTLLVTIIWLVIWILVQTLKWIVLAVVCILTALCPLLILLGALALIVVLVGLLALAVPVLAAVAAPLIPVAAVVAAAALALARVLCEAGWCRVLGAIGWALKWAIVLGAVLSVIMLSALSALGVTIYGGVITALIVGLERINCRIPHLLGLP